LNKIGFTITSKSLKGFFDYSLPLLDYYRFVLDYYWFSLSYSYLHNILISYKNYNLTIDLLVPSIFDDWSIYYDYNIYFSFAIWNALLNSSLTS
jgi:hypothetical protein